jgi:starch synthase
MALDAAWVMLGSGEPYTKSSAGDGGGSPDRVSATIGFDERLAHLIEAGADMFLMPSRYEPCGLNQMYSLRYGTVPIVRATGGLRRHRAGRDDLPGGTGITFEGFDPAAMVGAVRRALSLFPNPSRWKEIQQLRHAG